MNGRHEVRLKKIEESLDELHEKIDDLVENEAVNRTDIVWLKWGLRLVLAAVLGVGGVVGKGML